jgi:hypothetical protein
MPKKKVKVHISIKIMINMKANTGRIKKMVLEYLHIQMVINIQVNGLMIELKERVYSLIQMVTVMTDLILMENRTAKVFLPFMMAKNIKEIGKMDYMME